MLASSTGQTPRLGLSDNGLHLACALGTPRQLASILRVLDLRASPAVGRTRTVTPAGTFLTDEDFLQADRGWMEFGGSGEAARTPLHCAAKTGRVRHLFMLLE